MLEIEYSPEDVGKEVVSSRGKLSTIRKYHMTDKEAALTRNKWEKEIKYVDKRTVNKAGKHFFNPYRVGIYYYQIYSMFLLGANKWHSLSSIISKMENIMSKVSILRDGMFVTQWDKFRTRSNRDTAIKCKDYIGRIQENMVFFQRLTKLHPTGYKLRQVCSAVDMKRIDKAGFPNGCYFYKLSTYDTVEKALPIRDYSKFKFPRHERRYISYKFIGTVITKDKVIIEGKIDEVSPMQSG